MRKLFFTLPFSLILFIANASNVSAGLIRTGYQGANNNQSAFAGNVSSTDLINQGTTTFLSSSQTNYNPVAGAGQPTTVLNDGGIGAPSTNLAFSDGVLDGDGGFTVTYNLNLQRRQRAMTLRQFVHLQRISITGLGRITRSQSIL